MTRQPTHHIYIIAVIMLASCNTKHPTVATTSSTSASTSASKPQMLIIDGMLYRDGADNTYRFTLNNTQQADGKMKLLQRQTEGEQRQGLNYRLTDRNQNTLLRRHIDNPLSLTVEHFSPDGTMGRITQHLDSAQLYIRVPLQDGAGTIQLLYNDSLITQINI